MSTGNTSIPATFSAARNLYRGFDNRKGPGFNLYSSAAGMMIMGIPEAWANKAARLLNACETEEAQVAELQRIREAVKSA
jgi:hypothetical protein